jgi:hypothetical protein
MFISCGYNSIWRIIVNDGDMVYFL